MLLFVKSSTGAEAVVNLDREQKKFQMVSVIS